MERGAVTKAENNAEQEQSAPASMGSQKENICSITAQPPEELIPGLPYDIALNCLSRVPRWHHPVLSTVCKPIKSLLSSPYYFTAPSLHNFTENLIYLFFIPTTILHCVPHNLFYAFYRKRKPNSTNDKHKENLLHIVQNPPCPGKLWRSSYAALGSKIYVIGGLREYSVTAEVWILDCRLHIWERGPSMQLPRTLPGVVVFEGKIYVMGGLNCNKQSLDRAIEAAEVFDPATGRWETIPSPSRVEVTIRSVSASQVVGGMVCGTARSGVLELNPRTQTWREPHENELKLWPYSLRSTCSVVYV